MWPARENTQNCPKGMVGVVREQRAATASRLIESILQERETKLTYIWQKSAELVFRPKTRVTMTPTAYTASVDKAASRVDGHISNTHGRQEQPLGRLSVPTPKHRRVPEERMGKSVSM